MDGMKTQGNHKLITKVLIVGLLIAIGSYLFHPEVGQFSVMWNGEPIATPWLRFAALPTVLAIMLITGVLMVLLFLGVGVFLFMGAVFLALLGIFTLVPFFWPILLMIFLLMAVLSLLG
jgi:hypothetical protein